MRFADTRATLPVVQLGAKSHTDKSQNQSMRVYQHPSFINRKDSVTGSE